MKLSITSLYITPDAPKYEIIWTEDDNGIDRFLPEILMFDECSVLKYPNEQKNLLLCTDGHKQSEF